MGEILKNLNIRKFATKAAYNSATVGENDLCMVLDGSKPVLQVTTLPTASAAEAGNVYQYVGSTASGFTSGYFYTCVLIGGSYTWQHVNVQPNANYSTFITNTLEMTQDYNAIRIFPYVRAEGLYSNDTGEVLIRVVAAQGPGEFVAKITKLGNANVKSRVYVATGIFATARVYLQATSSTTTIRHICIEKDDGSPFLSGTGTSSSNINCFINYYGVNENTYGGIYATLHSHNPTYIAWRTLTEEDKPTQYTEFPTIAPYNLGQIAQYIGTTTASYTNGYFYKSVVDSVTPSSATATQTTGSSLSDVAVVVATFETQITASGSYAFTYDGADWSLSGETVNLATYGITFTGTPATDDVITVVYTEESTNYAWSRVDVQPSSGGGSSVTSISVTLAAADWSGGAQTVTVTGVTSSNTVIVGAEPPSQAEYTTCGVICTSQSTDSLGFGCTTTPQNDLTVTVLILS